MKTSISKASKKFYVTLSVLCIMALWQLAAGLLGKPFILPGPLETGKAIYSMLFDANFYSAVFGTLGRVLIVVMISSVLGIGFGMLAGKIKAVEYMLSPLVLLVKTIPTIVLIVYVVLWMSGYWAPIFVTVLITFPVVYGNVLEGYHAIDYKLMEMTKVFNFSRAKVLKYLIFPSLRPYIYAGILTILGLGLKVVIASEVLSQTRNSMGRAFQVARINIETQTVLGLAIITVLIAFGLEFFSKAMLKKMR